MKPITTLQQLADALGKKANVRAWEKGSKQRLYFNGLGYTTKKMETKAWIELCDGHAEAIVAIDCPSQSSNWIASQQAELKERMGKYVRYISRFFDFGVAGEPIEVVMHNALLDAEEVQGYCTEWRNVRVSINRFGKLADRNRQFVVAYKGTRSTAPHTFVPFSGRGYDWLVKIGGEIMLEPYAPLPDLDERAAFYARYEQQEQERKAREERERIATEEAKAEAVAEGKAKLQQLIAEGVDFLTAWKLGGCQHPAPAEVVEAKKASGLNWSNFVSTLQ